ncbi:hypothetical protein LTR78_009856 [Recurvomyces mirabilis]|uniref:Galactosyl transferase GMA12/MNN10 family protein n=1 Tax=Recurvomyces mirabilis TaxID=574656 RepID=A0AAE0TR75_9PEZI|nr:hypothetical protein LTR78_009856 [Recurvomyces mirabilis]KAK5153092.1 hypothetical protein LTS14_007736 [Recurvomyces mirabilis]
MVYGKSNTNFERALKTHESHSKQWGNGFEVLRQDLATGFWNKPTYILHVLTQELMKAPRERAEWLMWVDADSIIINPDISPELFLPPADLSQIHFVGTRDENGLNTGIFYLRVSTWSISFLIETLAMPLYEPDAGLGRSADQDAMSLVLHKEIGGPSNQGYRDAMVLIPRLWINTYEREEDGYEGKRGDMLVHFPGLEETRRKHMGDWLDVVESRPGVWRCALEETEYWNVTREYWREFRAAYELWKEVEALQDTEDISDATWQAATDLKKILETEADDIVKIGQLRSKLSSTFQFEGVNS